MIILTLLAGLLLSATAAYYSIVGLIAIFPGAVLPITLMGGSLEFAKLVAVSWLYQNWKDSPKLIKGYFIFSVLILMVITSLGTFGYLSKVHLETSTSITDNSVEISRLENELASQKQQLDNAQRSINILDDMVTKTQDSLEANKIRNRQKAERSTLSSVISESSQTINKININLSPLRKENLKKEAEVGPLKYIAELIYGADAISHFDSAVRFVIILIVLVFDPLAILLLIAANISISKKQETPVKKKRVATSKDMGYNKSMAGSIYKFMMKDDFGMKAVDKIDKDTK